VKQVGNKKGSAPISLQNELLRLRSCMYSVSSVFTIATRKPPAISRIDPQSSEKIPLEAPYSIDKLATRIQSPRLLRKHNSALDNIISPKSEPRPKNSRSRKSKLDVQGNAACATEVVPSIPNETAVAHNITEDHQSTFPASAIAHSQIPINDNPPSTSIRSTWPNFTPIQTYWLRFARGKEIEQ
jgi:hypothetical protein